METVKSPLKPKKKKPCESHLAFDAGVSRDSIQAKGRVTHMEEKEKKKPSILILSRKPFVVGELVPWI